MKKQAGRGAAHNTNIQAQLYNDLAHNHLDALETKGRADEGVKACSL